VLEPRCLCGKASGDAAKGCARGPETTDGTQPWRRGPFSFIPMSVWVYRSARPALPPKFRVYLVLVLNRIDLSAPPSGAAADVHIHTQGPKGRACGTRSIWN
jgi:hypothetical protein